MGRGAPESKVLKHVAAAAAVLALAWWTYAIYGPHVIDDSYITLRYARSVLQGTGLCYNPGEHVQGFSSPLHILLLLCFGGIGVPLEGAALTSGLMGGFALAALIVWASRAMESPWNGWPVLALLSTHFLWVIMLVSGLETPLACAATFATLSFAALQRWRFVGLAAGLLVLTRIDGSVAACFALATVAIFGGWREGAKQAGIAAAIFGPWSLFSWIYFGSPIPQTIAAKGVLHAGNPWSLTWDYYKMWWGFTPVLLAVLVFALIGSIALARKSRSWLVLPCWVLAFHTVFLGKHVPVMFYVWYLLPSLPVIYFLAVEGFRAAIAQIVNFGPPRAKLWAETAAQGAMLLAATVLTAHGLRRIREFESWQGVNAMNREKAYAETAAVLNAHLQPGDRVLVVETGALGWYMPTAEIVDGCGLVSPGVARIWAEDRRNNAAMIDSSTGYTPSVEALLKVLDEFKPRYITTRKIYLGLDRITANPEFTSRYREMTEPGLQVFDQWAFERIPDATIDKSPITGD